MDLSGVCDIKSLQRQIRNIDRKIARINKKIAKLETRRANSLAKWENASAGIDAKIAQVEDAINVPKQRELDALNDYINKKKAAVEAEFAPKLNNLNSQCVARQQAFDQAMIPINAKLQLNIAERARLQQLYDSAPNDQKITYRQQLAAMDRFISDFQAQIAASQRIHDERMRGCDASDKGSLMDQKAKALAYWDAVKQKSIDYINAKYSGTGGGSGGKQNTRLQVLLLSKQRITDRISAINSGFDEKIDNERAAISYYENLKSGLQNTITFCSGG